jgi:hypothetical protein
MSNGWIPTSGSGGYVGLLVGFNVNQTGTASGNYTGIRVNMTETAILGTAHRLLDLQVGSSSKFAIDNTGSATAYGGTALQAAGLVSEVSTLNTTGLTAAISNPTALYTVPPLKGGLYRVTYYAKVTTAASGGSPSSTLGGTAGFTLSYTDPVDSTTPTVTIARSTSGMNLSGNTTTTVDIGSIVVNLKTGTVANYGYDYTSSGTTPMAYLLRIRVEYLG